jgi:hypothetical protein
VGQRFGGIQRFTAADTQHRRSRRFPPARRRSISFCEHSPPNGAISAQSGIFKALTQGLFGKTQHKFIADDQPAFCQRFQIVAETGNNISALDVLPAIE